MIAAAYRVLYGEDYILDSIRSVHDAVDKIYVFWTNTPFGGVTEVEYRGETVKFPKKIDRCVDLVKAMNSPKICLIEKHFYSPHNQLTEMAKSVAEDILIFIEPDMVMRDAKAAIQAFKDSGHKCAYVKQVEWWKCKKYRIPYRDRPGPVLWRMPVGDTKPNGIPRGDECPALDQWADNYGFCLSEKNMYWKHLLAMAFSSKIKDSIPREEWYEDVWLKWTPDMKNLEIAKNFAGNITHAYEA